MALRTRLATEELFHADFTDLSDETLEMRVDELFRSAGANFKPAGKDDPPAEGLEAV